MLTAQKLAKRFQSLYFGHNWTSTNVQSQLEQTNLELATKKLGEHNSLAALLFHITYYIEAQLKVLEGGPLDAHDRFSYDVPDFANEAEWETFKAQSLQLAERYIKAVEGLSEEAILQHMADPKYGSWQQNIQGIIEHSYYHFGQMVVLRKLLSAKDN
ncbi:MAG: DUF1572 domain-containing protein [Bacteroidota bacterium]